MHGPLFHRRISSQIIHLFLVLAAGSQRDGEKLKSRLDCKQKLVTAAWPGSP